MKITITVASNGAILESEENVGVYEFDELDVSGLVGLLRDVADSVGPQTSRYSRERVKISVSHGDKFEHSDGEKCELCQAG